MLDLNEFLTRKMKIDVLLKEHGWDVGDRSKVVLEVDTIQSDIKSRITDRSTKPAEMMLKASMRTICFWTVPENRLPLLKPNEQLKTLFWDRSRLKSMPMI